MDTKVQGLVSDVMGKIHELADTDTVIGKPIKVDNSTIIPVSKITYGFAGGGSDLPNKSDKECFGGGTGAGVTVQPLGFIVVSEGDVRFLQINLDKSTSSAIVNMVPEVFAKVQSLFKKDKKEDEFVPTGKEDTLDAVDDLKTEEDLKNSDFE